MFTDLNKQDIFNILQNNSFDINNSLIISIKKIPGGTDTDIYFFRVKTSNFTVPLILKLFRNRLPPTRAYNEYVSLCNLLSSEIKVPKPLGFRDKNCSFSRPFMIMEFVEGELLSNIIYDNLNRNSNLYKNFINNLILIHNMNWLKLLKDVNIPDIKSDPFIIIKSIINRSKTLIQQYSISEFFPIINWLEMNMKDYPCESLVVCHGDYHPKNIIVTATNELVTIDWSNISLGDRRSDLAFSIVVMSSETTINIEELIIESYEELTGITIQGIAFFKILMNLFNFIRMYSAAVDFTITQETDSTRNVFLDEYKPYCKTVLSLMEQITNNLFPTIEEFLNSN